MRGIVSYHEKLSCKIITTITISMGGAAPALFYKMR